MLQGSGPLMALGEMRCCKGSPSSLLQQCRESQHGCPGAWWGLASGWQPEDAVLLRSSFLKTCLAPFDWEGGIQVAETGRVGEGEEKLEMVQ